MIKPIRYLIEAMALFVLFAVFKIMPPSIASAIGGWIGRNIAFRFAVSRKARRHITRAMPNLSEDEINLILRGMWDNLGRVIAEYPHLEKIGRDYTIIENKDIVLPSITNKQPIMFIGGHIGNWEVNAAATLMQLNHPITLTYRAPNNPWTAWLLNKARTLNGRLKAFPKSHESGRHIMRTLKESGSLGILIDQKYNEGIESHFFALPAMTNPVFVQLCQKYKCPLVPVRNERIKGCHFKLTPCSPIPVFDSEGKPRDIMDVVNDANALLEKWITDRPEQWIWLHRRWKEL